MTMVKRDEITQRQITAAKVMPGPRSDEDTEGKIPESDISVAAERQATSTTPGAPARLPGYGK